MPILCKKRQNDPKTGIYDRVTFSQAHMEFLIFLPRPLYFDSIYSTFFSSCTNLINTSHFYTFDRGYSEMLPFKSVKVWSVNEVWAAWKEKLWVNWVKIKRSTQKKNQNFHVRLRWKCPCRKISVLGSFFAKFHRKGRIKRVSYC